MKIHQLWIGVIICVCVFLYSSGKISPPSQPNISTKSYNALYFNGYLNFCFNGVTKLLTGEGFKEDVAGTDMIIKRGYTQAKPSTEVGFRGEQTVQGKANEAMNGFLKSTTGKDMDDISQQLSNLPLD